MSKPLNWNGIRDFLAAAEAGSLTKAAVALRLSQPTLSRRLNELEEQLGTRLLVRGPRHFKLTEAGETLLRSARRMGIEATKIADLGRGDQPLAGLVRIAATEAFSSIWLMHQLADFLQAYPEIRLEVLAENTLTDLLGRRSDVAIRAVRPTQKDLVTKRVGTLKTGFFAAVSYVEQFGLPDTRADLARHRVIGIEGQRQFAGEVDAILGTDRTVLRLRNLQDVRSVVHEGLGIGPMLCFDGNAQPDLVQVLAKEPLIEKEIWLTAQPEISENPRIRHVFDYLAQVFAAQRDQFS